MSFWSFFTAVDDLRAKNLWMESQLKGRRILREAGERDKKEHDKKEGDNIPNRGSPRQADIGDIWPGITADEQKRNREGGPVESSQPGNN